MKKFTGVLICSYILGSLVNAAAETASGRYETKSAVIEFMISGNIKGTETAYIDHYGEKESRFSKYILQMTGNDKEQERLTVREGDLLTNVDLRLNKAVNIDLNKEMTPGLNIHLTGKEMADYSPEGLKKMRAVYVGEESVAGKSCKVYELPFLKSRLWIYKNIALRYRSNTRGFLVEYIATAIKEDVDIPEERFSVPQGVMNVGLVPQNNILGAIQPKTQ
ncbi:MAG: hypothetical protein AB7S78_13855 [Candidatus Omnitrophota bacterium]